MLQRQSAVDLEAANRPKSLRQTAKVIRDQPQQNAEQVKPSADTSGGMICSSSSVIFGTSIDSDQPDQCMRTAPLATPEQELSLLEMIAASTSSMGAQETNLRLPLPPSAEGGASGLCNRSDHKLNCILLVLHYQGL